MKQYYQKIQFLVTIIKHIISFGSFIINIINITYFDIHFKLHRHNNLIYFINDIINNHIIIIIIFHYYNFLHFSNINYYNNKTFHFNIIIIRNIIILGYQDK